MLKHLTCDQSEAFIALLVLVNVHPTGAYKTVHRVVNHI